MTKKHFEKLAEHLKYAAPRSSRIAALQHARDVKTVADVCAYFNDNFDRARFLRAAGVGE